MVVDILDITTREGGYPALLDGNEKAQPPMEDVSALAEVPREVLLVTGSRQEGD